jgi:2'-5' RNA ligase
MKQLYFIAIVPPPPIAEQVHAFKTELTQRFGTKVALKSPPHITLFAPFWFDESDEHLLAGAMQKAISGFAPFETTLENFSCFPPRVLFVAVNENKDFNRLARSVADAQLQVEGMKQKQADEKFHPHMTIGNRDWSAGDFTKAWEEFRGRKFSAEFTVAEIQLLRLENGKWKTAATVALAG